MTTLLLIILGIILVGVYFIPTQMDILEDLISEEATLEEKNIFMNENKSKQERAEALASILDRLRNKGLIDFNGNALDHINQDKI